MLLRPLWLAIALLLTSPIRGDGKSLTELLGNSTKTVPLNGRKEGPLEVHIGMYIESIGNFRSSEMSFDVDLYMYMSWLDTRLKHNFSNHVLVNDVSIRDQIWLPDLYFANARRSTFQYVTVPNFNLFIAQDGTASYSLRATCSISCSLELVNYPMDRQLCYIQVLSYAHVAEQVNVHWFTDNAVRHNADIGLPEFSITNVSTAYCNGTYRYALTENSHKIGKRNFSCLMANIFLSRSIGYNLVQSYIPTGLIVMISWVSFWIDRRAVPARVTLSFTTLVSLTTLGNGLRYDLPQVSYAKAIDLWYGACLLFVFCALLEFAIINSYMRKAEKYDHMAKRLQMPSRNSSQAGRQSGSESTRETCFTGVSYDHLTGERRNGGTYLTDYSFLDRRHVKFDPAPIKNEDYRPYIDQSEDSNDSPKELKVNSLIEQTYEFSDTEGCNEIRTRVKPMFNAAAHAKCLRRNSSDSSEASDEEKKAIPTTNTAHHFTLIAINASRRALKIDKMCRLGFPIVFVVFNTCYWSFYMIIEKRHPLV